MLHHADYGSDTIEFDSYMIPTSYLNNGDLRLLEVDNRIIVPIQTQVRVLVKWVRGGFSVSNATLNRFYSLHYLLLFVLAALAIVLRQTIVQ